MVILGGGIACFAILNNNNKKTDNTLTEQLNGSDASQDENDTTDEAKDTENGYRIVIKPYEYNPVGQLINGIVFDTPETIPQPWAVPNAMANPVRVCFYWVYNSSNQVIGCYSVRYDDITQINTFEYNDKGEVVKHSLYQNSKKKGMDLGFDFEYEYNGELISKITQKYNGIDYGSLVEGEVIVSDFSYENNKLSNIVSTYYMGNNTRVKNDIFTYNQAGQCTNITWYYEDSDNFKYNENFEYENGILVSHGSTVFDKNGNSTDTGNHTYEYDNNNSLIKIDGVEIVRSSKLTVNESGELIKID